MADAERHTRARSTLPSPRPLSALLIGAAVVGVVGLVFALAGQLEWTCGEIYLGLMVVVIAINLACLLRWNPSLIWRRIALGNGTKTWDIVWIVLATPLFLAVYFVALVVPRGAAPSVPDAGWLLGMALFVPGWVMILWSMIVNPFFEKTVRIQTEHGHHVIDTGPYAYVRHPGYVGFSGWILSTPLLLPSSWAFVPVLLAVASLVIRTALEDRTLHAELPGYAEYAGRVRFRLIPGLW